MIVIVRSRRPFRPSRDSRMRRMISREWAADPRRPISAKPRFRRFHPVGRFGTVIVLDSCRNFTAFAFLLGAEIDAGGGGGGGGAPARAGHVTLGLVDPGRARRARNWQRERGADGWRQAMP
jgi:hypothetical protein